MPVIQASRGALVAPQRVKTAAPSVNEGTEVNRAVGRLLNTATALTLQDRQIRKKKEDDLLSAQFLEYKTALKNFDERKKFELRNAESNKETIINAKKTLIKERQNFIKNLSSGFDNDRLKSIITSYNNNSNLDFELDIDKDLSKKQEEYKRSTIFNSIDSLSNQFDFAEDAEDVARINEDLKEVLSVGLQSGAITRNDFRQELKRVEDIQKAKIEQFEKDELKRQIRDGSYIINPRDRDDQKLVQELYDNGFDNDDSNDSLNELITRSGVLPEKKTNNLVATLLAGDADSKAKASEEIADLVKKNVSLQDNFTSKDLGYAQMINKGIEAGLDPKDAVKYADATRNKIAGLGMESRKEEFRAYTRKDSSGESIMTSKYDKFKADLEDEEGIDFFKENPEIPAILGMEFQFLTEQFFLNQEVDFDTAVDMAKNKIKNDYKLTKIGKKRYMKNPVEKFYKYSEDVLKTDFLKFLEEKGLDPDQQDNYILEVVPSTLGTKNEIFSLMHISDGILQNVYPKGGNLPITYKPKIKR